MKPRIYYIVTNTDDNTTVYVNNTKEIEELTGVERGLFYKMLPGELYIINHWQIICDQTMPKDSMYYKNLWREL